MAKWDLAQVCKAGSTSKSQLIFCKAHDYLIRCRKRFGIIGYPFMIIMLDKLDFFNLKRASVKTSSKIIINSKRLDMFPLRVEAR